MPDPRGPFDLDDPGDPPDRDLPEGIGEASPPPPSRHPPREDPRLKIPEVLREPATPPKVPDKGTAVSDGIQMGRAWATALNFVATIIGGALLGWLYDKWRGTSPVGAGIGLGLGFVIAFIQIVRSTQKQEAAERDRKNRS